ncbi:MAG: hypothetical protein WDA27_12085 [Actinomycetota bacterium]
MNDDELIRAIHQAGEVPPPPDRDGAFERAMLAAQHSTPHHLRRGIVTLIAAAIVLAPVGVFATIGHYSKARPAPTMPAVASPSPSTPAVRSHNPTTQTVVKDEGTEDSSDDGTKPDDESTERPKTETDETEHTSDKEESNSPTPDESESPTEDGEEPDDSVEAPDD